MEEAVKEEQGCLVIRRQRARSTEASQQGLTGIFDTTRLTGVHCVPCMFFAHADRWRYSLHSCPGHQRFHMRRLLHAQLCHAVRLQVYLLKPGLLHDLVLALAANIVLGTGWQIRTLLDIGNTLKYRIQNILSSCKSL